MYPESQFLGEKRLRWFGYVQLRDKDDATRKILKMTVDGKRNRGRPKLRWRDLVKEDMVRNRMTTEIYDRRQKNWHVMTCFILDIPININPLNLLSLLLVSHQSQFNQSVHFFLLSLAIIVVRQL